MRRSITPACFCGLLAFVSIVAEAQRPITTIPHAFAGERGAALSRAGDMNGDGVSDLVVGGAPGAPPRPAAIYSGADGSLLHVVTYASQGMRVGFAGDPDHDGFADVALADGVVLLIVHGGTFQETVFNPPAGSSGLFGASVCDAGDLDGDGSSDLLVASSGYFNPPQPLPGHLPCDGWTAATYVAGRLYAFSGATGQPIIAVTGQPGDPYPTLVAPLGDVTGDGRPDFIVASDGNPAYVFSCFGGAFGGNNPAHSSRLEVRSGATGALVWSLSAAAAHVSATSAGDVTGDGRPDVIARFEAGGGIYTALFDGATGVELSSILDYVAAGSASVATVGDQDGDGVPDHILGDGGASRIRVLSGNSLATVRTISGPPGSGFGSGLAALGDVDGDGRGDFVVSALWIDMVQVFSGATAGNAAVQYSGPSCIAPPVIIPVCPANEPLVSTAPRLGRTATISGLRAPTMGDGVLLLSAVPAAPVQIDAGSSFSLPYLVFVDLASVMVAPLSLGPDNAWAIPLDIPVLPALDGLSFALQAGYWPTSGGFFPTNGVYVTIGS